MVLLLFNVVNPETFNDDNNVELLFNVVNPLTFKDDNNVLEVFNVVDPDTFKLISLNDEKVVEPFIYPNILVGVLFKSLIYNIDVVDKLFSLFSLLVILELIPETSTGAGGPPVQKLL